MAAAAGSYGKLDKSFKLAARSVLTAFSREEEFRNFCDEIEIATALDKVDQFVEEQTLDVLSSDKTSIEDMKERISKEKKDEIELLKGLLEKTQERNNAMKARIEPLKQGGDFNDTRDVLAKLKEWNTACQSCNDH